MESAVLVRKISTEDWREKVSLYLYCTYHTHIHLPYLLCLYLLYPLPGAFMSPQRLGHPRPPAAGGQQGYQYRTLLSRPSHTEGTTADLELNCCMLGDLDCITGMLIVYALLTYVYTYVCL